MKIPVVCMRVLPLIRERELALAIALPYCNFRCPWCHAGYIVYPRNIVELEVDVLRHVIRKYSDELGINWVLVTGGEPTLHPKAVYRLFTLCRELEVKCILDTNLTNPNIIKLLLDGNLLNYVHCDVKAPLSNIEKYALSIGLNIKQTNQYISKIRKSLKLISSSRAVKEIEIRTLIIPEILNKKDVLQLVKDLLEIPIDLDKTIYVLEQFTPTPHTLSKDYRYRRETPIEYLEEIALQVKNTYNIKIHVRAMTKFFNDITRSKNIVRDFNEGKIDPSLWEFSV